MKYTYHEDGAVKFFHEERFDHDYGIQTRTIFPDSEDFESVKAACEAQQVRDYCHTDYEIRKRTITTNLESGKVYEIG